MLPNALVFVDVPQYGLQLLEGTPEVSRYKKILLVDRDLLARDKYANSQLLGYDHVIPVALHSESDLLQAQDQIAASYHVQAVLGFSEISVLPAAFLADAFGVQGIGLETAKTCRNKRKMMEVLDRAGVACPRSLIAGPEQDLGTQIETLGGFPVICKPLMGFASFGVIRVENEFELKKAVRRIRRSTRLLLGRYYGLDPSGSESDILVQSFIPGIEVCIDGYVHNGKSHVWAVIDKPDVSQGPYFADAMHIAPSALERDTVQIVENTVHRAVMAVGLDNSPFHVEARVHEGKCYILELAARVAFVRVLRAAIGVDPMAVLIALRLGEEPEVESKCEHYAGGYCLTPQEAGIFSHIGNRDEVLQDQRIIDISIYLEEGSRVAPAPESTGDVAHVRACAETYEDVLAALTQAKEKLSVVLQSATNNANKDRTTVDSSTTTIF